MLEQLPFDLSLWSWALSLLFILGTVNTTWTDPSSSGTPKMDLATNDELPEDTWDALMSDLNALGGSTGRRPALRREWVKGADVASAATLTLGTDGNVFTITGSTGPVTTINAGAAGTIVVLVFASTPTITHHATNLILRDGLDFTAAAGDVLVLVSTGSSTVREVCRQLASEIATQAEMEAATSLTKTVTPGRTKYHPGVAKAWCNFDGSGTPVINASYNIASITDHGTGDWSLNFTVAMSSATYCVVANGSLTTTIAGSTSRFLVPRGGGYGTAAIRVVAADGGSGFDNTQNDVVVFGDQ